VHTDRALAHTDQLVSGLEATLDVITSSASRQPPSPPVGAGVTDVDPKGATVRDVPISEAADAVTSIDLRKVLGGAGQKPASQGQHMDETTPRSGSTRRTDSGRGSRWDRHIQRRLADDVRQVGLREGPPHPARVTDADLIALPEPAERFLRFMGVPDRPRDQAFATRFVGQIRMRPDRGWMPFHAWQFNAADPVTRINRMRIDVARIIPMFGTDTYVHRSGRMHGKVLGLITVADGEGPEFDLGELVTYVNDAAMLAPSMLLTPNCEWTTVDDDSFDVTFTDGDNVVRARLVVDDVGRLVDFHTDDRWFAGTDPPTQTPWSTPIGGWTTTADGRPVPSFGSAVWHLPDGDFTYVRGRFDATTMHVGTDALGVLAGGAAREST
jgi:hypothetical protein